MFNCSPAKSHKLHRSFSWTAEEKFSRRALDCSYVSAGLVRTCAVIISNCSHASHVVLVSCISVCEFNSLADWIALTSVAEVTSRIAVSIDAMSFFN
jgi:hypothetical protein